MALRELLATFNVDASQAVEGLKGLDAKIEGAASQLGAFTDALLGSLSGGALLSFVEGAIEAGSAVNDMAERLGVGTDELQSFQFAAGLAGVGAEDAARSLQFLNKNIGEALDNNAEAVKSFAALDVAIKNPDGSVRELGDVVPEVADAFAKMGSDQERTATAMKLFGKSGAALIPLLKGGSAGLEEMRAEFEALGGGMSKDFIAAADKTGDELDKLKFGVRNVKMAIAGALLPYVQKAIAVGQEWAKRLVKMTKETNVLRYAVALFAALAAVSIGKAAAGFAKMFGLMPQGKTGLLSLLRSFGAFGAIVAVVGGLLLVLEDLFTAVQDGDSEIVSLVEHYLGIEEANGLVKELKSAWEAVKQAVAPLEPLLDTVGESIGKIAAEYGPKVLKVFVEIVRTVAEAITKVADFFGLLNSEKTGDVSGDVLRRRAEGLAARTAPLVSPTDLPKAPVNGPSNVSMNQRNEVNVNVQGGPTPQATGAAVKDGVRGALSGSMLANVHAQIEGGG